MYINLLSNAVKRRKTYRGIHVNEKPRQSIVIMLVKLELVERRSANKFRGD